MSAISQEKLLELGLTDFLEKIFDFLQESDMQSEVGALFLAVSAGAVIRNFRLDEQGASDDLRACANLGFNFMDRVSAGDFTDR